MVWQHLYNNSLNMIRLPTHYFCFVEEEKIELKDTPSYLEAFESYYKAFNEDKDVSSLIHKVLSNVEFWGRDLSLEEGLEAEVIKYFTHIISSSSAYKALEEFNKHAI